MAVKTKKRTASEVEEKVLAALKAGLTMSDIADKFDLSERTVYRIKDRHDAESGGIVSVEKRVKKVARSDKPSRKEVAKNDGAVLQQEIANVAFSKALALFASIDPSKMQEGQKAMSGGILLDKARLITGQASSISEHRDVQIVALGLLDKRLKESKGKAPKETIIDVKAEPVAQLAEDTPDENPCKPDAALQPEK